MSTKLGRAPAWVDNLMRRGIGGPPLVRPPSLAFQPLVPSVVPAPRDRVMVVTIPGRLPMVVKRMDRLVISETEARTTGEEISRRYPGAKIQTLRDVHVGPGGAISVDGRPVIGDLKVMPWP